MITPQQARTEGYRGTADYRATCQKIDDAIRVAMALSQPYARCDVPNVYIPLVQMDYRAYYTVSVNTASFNQTVPSTNLKFVPLPGV